MHVPRFMCHSVTCSCRVLSACRASTQMAYVSDEYSALPAAQTTAGSREADGDWLMQRFVVEFRDGLYTYADGKSAALIVVYVLLFVASVVGNVAVLRIVLPFRRMRSVTHYFIINLAAADLLRTSASLSVSLRGGKITAWGRVELLAVRARSKWVRLKHDETRRDMTGQLKHAKSRHLRPKRERWDG